MESDNWETRRARMIEQTLDLGATKPIDPQFMAIVTAFMDKGSLAGLIHGRKSLRLKLIPSGRLPLTMRLRVSVRVCRAAAVSPSLLPQLAADAARGMVVRSAAQRCASFGLDSALL